MIKNTKLELSSFKPLSGNLCGESYSHKLQIRIKSKKIVNEVKNVTIRILIGIVIFSYNSVLTQDFTFQRWLFGDPGTLSLSINFVDTNTGQVQVNGNETNQVTGPFTWDWGDGTVVTGWFPQQHTYTNLTSNYIVQVTSHYQFGATDSIQVLIRFVSPTVEPQTLPPELAVTIPDHNVTLSPRNPPGYSPPVLTFFDDSFFETISRSTIEYILSVLAVIEMDLANDDVFLLNNGFEQVVLRNPNAGGMYSIWFTDPVAFASGDAGFQGNLGWSSFMHEMGHNFTLNSPADFFYGGKIDGNANAIFSETMAQIFQHATAYIMINNYMDYGIGEDLIFEITQSAISSIQLVRNIYDSYINSGMNFYSWNNPSTSGDETFKTFMTIAFKFCEHAENSGQGYQLPLKGMMELLQIFNQDIKQGYDQFSNNAQADTFRATLMVTAMSHGFSTDLRTEFRDLNFPISDQIYDELLSQLSVNNAEFPVPTEFEVKQNYPNPFNSTTTIEFSLPISSLVTLTVHDILGRKVKMIMTKNMDAGIHTVQWNAHSVPTGIYFVRLVSGDFTQTRKVMVLK